MAQCNCFNANFAYIQVRIDSSHTIFLAIILHPSPDRIINLAKTERRKYGRFA